MATAEVAARPQQDRPSRRKPFAQWVKNLTSLKNKSGDQQEKQSGKKNGGLLPGSKHKKSHTVNGTLKNHPYPQSGHLQARGPSPASSANGQLSFTTMPREAHENGSFNSLPTSTLHEREAHSNSNRSGAPTLATNPETVHSDAGHSKAATTTTHGGALSSIDGAGRDSTFSSPNQSQHSLTTTLTTIQSSSHSHAHQHGNSGHPHQNYHGSPNPIMFSHQFPVSPAQSSTNAISAIPRHMAENNQPNTYNSATANNLLTDNASILTLASSSKRQRRRSMDTDASVRALAPSSVFGGSRESLPLSVLSGNVDTSAGGWYTGAQSSRPSIGGLASPERASLYSSQGVAAPALASERNSYYSPRHTKDYTGDAKSLRSVMTNNLDARSADARSINLDARSMTAGGAAGGEGGRGGYEGSVRSGKLGHARNDSVPGSASSPLTSPALMRQASASGALSRRSSDWTEVEKEMRGEKGEEEEEEETTGDGHEHDVEDGGLEQETASPRALSEPRAEMSSRGMEGGHGEE